MPRCLLRVQGDQTVMVLVTASPQCHDQTVLVLVTAFPEFLMLLCVQCDLTVLVLVTPFPECIMFCYVFIAIRLYWCW